MDGPLRSYHIRTGVRDVFSRHGMSHDSPLFAEIEANATIAAGDPSRVIMKNGNSLDAELESRLSSMNIAENFQSSSRTLAKSDRDGVRDHFADIAAGKIIVEK